MLRRLFGGEDALEDTDPQKRRQAVLALSNAEAAEKTLWLEERLTSDPDPGVRRACLERISRVACLQSVLDDTDLGEPAARRIVELMPESEPDEHPRVTEMRVLQLPPEAAGELAARLQDTDQLISLALRARDPLRQSLLDHPLLRCSKGLTRLEKRSRGHDKTLNRHTREALDSLKEQRQEAQATLHRAEELSAALGRSALGTSARTEHSRRLAIYQAFIEAVERYDQLRASLSSWGERLPAIDTLRAATAEPPEVAMDRQHAPKDAYRDPGGTRSGESAEAMAQATADGGEPFAELVVELDALNRDLTDPRDFASLAQACDGLTRKWRGLAEHQAPAAHQLAAFTSVSQRVAHLTRAAQHLESAVLPDPAGLHLPEVLPAGAAGQRPLWARVAENQRLAKELAGLRQEIDWPEWANPPPRYTSLLEIQHVLKVERARAEGLLSAQLTQMQQQLAQLENAVDNGGINEGQLLLGELRSLCDVVPGAAVAGLQKQLGRCASRLAELKDWQTFATTPKRQALCEAMGSLAETPLAPRRQADRIKKLRADWQALGPVTRAADRQLAVTFNEQADKAFEPCRQFFAAQAEQRQQNLSARQSICDQLEAYLQGTDWRQADMKAAERIMRTARNEWRRFHPVDRNPGAVLEARFEALQEQLFQKVKAEWERNLGIKNDIVIEAEALTGSDASPQARIAAVKALQQRWQAVGITPHKPDQALWQRFRAACDLVFVELDAGRKALQTETEAQRLRAEKVLDGFAASLNEKTAESTADAAEQSALSGFMQLKSELEKLPAAVRSSLLRRHQELSDRYRALLAQRAVVERSRTLTELRLADAAALATEGESVADIDALRRMTVQAEVAAGLNSPPSDEPLRLQLQVERLNAGFSGSADVPDPLTLARRWRDLGTKPQAVDPLRERFFNALLQGWD